MVVDYYLLLNNLVGELSTQDVNVLFKEKLRATTTEMSDGKETTVLQMGSLSIDPGFTDFVGKRTLNSQWQRAEITVRRCFDQGLKESAHVQHAFWSEIQVY